MSVSLLRVAVLVGAVAVARGCESATSLIEQAEGFRACTYVDTTGHKTICYGFNLDAFGAKGKVEAVGGDWDKVYNHAGCLSKSQCEQLLSSAVSSAASSAESIFGNQCACVQAVLTDMTYNLGSAGMSSFHGFVNFVKEHDYASAAADGKGTLWCRQVGSRCSRDMDILKRGCSEEEAGGPASSGSHHGSAATVAAVVGGCAAVALVALVAVMVSKRRARQRGSFTLVLTDIQSYGTI